MSRMTDIVSSTRKPRQAIVLVQGMSYTRLSFLRASLVEGQRCDLTEGLVWPVAVMNVLPSAEKLANAGEGGGVREAVVELLLVGALGTFNMAVELGEIGRQDEEFDAAQPAGVFELGHQLGAAVHLDRSDGEGHAVEIVSRKPA